MVKFILGFHCHQPVGNFDFVFKEVHKKSYSPLIRTLTALNVKFCLHASGILLEWWEKNDPELIGIISEGVEKGSIEIIGGGYYEPILASIRGKDRLRQLEMLNKALKRLFGKYPMGAWITERIWQPDIIKDLKEAGLGYAFLDDYQFFQAGISQDEIDNIFMTEYEGQYFSLFPIHERLRYKIPFAEPIYSLNEVMYLNGSYSKLSVMFDDGEKMGGWPDTYEWVYGKDDNSGWLKNFINEANSNTNYTELSFELPSDILKNTEDIPGSMVPVYLPISSYREMGEWTLPIKKRADYEEIRAQNPSAPLSGGIWHNFLTRYPEANLQHKRMLHLSNKINYSINAYHKEHLAALDELMKSQANDAYWHGVFGGIYLPHLRRAIHKALITSYALYKEDIKESLEKEYYDFDSDGEKEIQLSNERWMLIYKPSAGSLLALDFIEKDLMHSLGDVFCLHEEYDILKVKEHKNIYEKEREKEQNENFSKEANANPPKTIHNEAKFPSDLSAEDLIMEPGILPAFEILFNGNKISLEEESLNIKEDKIKNRIELSAFGLLNLNLNIAISDSLEFFTSLDAKKSGNLDIIYRFSFPGGDGPAVGIAVGEETMGINNRFEKEIKTGKGNFIYFQDSFWGGKIKLKEKTDAKFLKKYNLIFKPITTISLSEKGYERIFQGIELKYRFNLIYEETFSSIINIEVEKI